MQIAFSPRILSLWLAYQHDYQCLPESLLKMVSVDMEKQRRMERFEAVKQSSAAARFYQ